MTLLAQSQPDITTALMNPLVARGQTDRFQISKERRLPQEFSIISANPVTTDRETLGTIYGEDCDGIYLS